MRFSALSVAYSVCWVAILSGCSASSGDGAYRSGPRGSGGSAAVGTGGGTTASGNQPSLGGSMPDLTPVDPPAGEECAAVLELTIRDFTPEHPDFESYNGLNDIGCGMVESALGPDTKPVFFSGIGSKKRVTMNDATGSLAFKSCDDWNGWMPDKVITDAASFDQWYRDVAGVNEVITVPITLEDVGGGNVAYDSSAFFPIDGMGMGNTPNQQHNFHFTTEGHATFGYVKGQKFTFRGDDDLWIFVNGKLALDLGGMHMPIAATIDFDAQAAELGIVPGGTYQMDIFHAERHTSESNFRIETNIRCFTPVVVK
jgi:fibro-slime domain-containing protein